MKRLTGFILILSVLHFCTHKNHNIRHTEDTMQGAVLNFLQAIANEDREETANRHFDREEYTTIFHHEFRNYPAATSRMNPDEAWEIINPRRAIGLNKLARNLHGKKIKSIRIILKKNSPVSLDNITAHLPDVIFVETDQGEVSIEEIGTIIEYNNRFKVGTITTG